MCLFFKCHIHNCLSQLGCGFTSWQIIMWLDKYSLNVCKDIPTKDIDAWCVSNSTPCVGRRHSNFIHRKYRACPATFGMKNFAWHVTPKYIEQFMIYSAAEAFSKILSLIIITLKYACLHFNSAHWGLIKITCICFLHFKCNFCIIMFPFWLYSSRMHSAPWVVIQKKNKYQIR